MADQCLPQEDPEASPDDISDVLEAEEASELENDQKFMPEIHEGPSKIFEDTIWWRLTNDGA